MSQKKATRRSRFRFAAVFVALAVIAGACGSSSNTSSSDTTEAATTDGGEDPTTESSGEPITIGSLAILEGAFAGLGEDSIRGVEMAIEEFGGKVAGREIVLEIQSTDASPESATSGVRQLVEQQGVDVVVGPLSGDEGIAVAAYAKSQPDITFVNGSSGASDTTLRDPADNFFRFNTDGAQWMAGLGEYAFGSKGYKRIVTVAEDYSFPYTQVAGFAIGYCSAGGEIVDRFWTPIGTTDYSSVVASIPADIDAVYVALGGADAVNFLTQYQQFGGTAPLVAGTITLDQTILGSTEISGIIGTPASGPIADTSTDSAWTDWVSAYQTQFPDGFPSPSLFAHAYYVNTKALLLAIEETGGDTGLALQAALSNIKFDSPTGVISLDENRQAIGDVYLTEVIEGPDGNLLNDLIEVTPQVNQTLGQPVDDFLALGTFDRDNPDCGDF